jgi:hypothetical protein
MKDIGVYLFHNVHTGFFYIGSGILDARERAHFGALKKRAHWNPNLQAAFDSRLSSDTFPNWTGVETNIQGDGA